MSLTTPDAPHPLDAAVDAFDKAMNYGNPSDGNIRRALAAAIRARCAALSERELDSLQRVYEPETRSEDKRRILAAILTGESDG